MKCDRCGSTENVQRSLVVDMPAVCFSCMEGDEKHEGWYFVVAGLHGKTEETDDTSTTR